MHPGCQLGRPTKFGRSGPGRVLITAGPGPVLITAGPGPVLSAAAPRWLGAHLRKSGTSRSSSSSKTTDERRVLGASGTQGAPVPGPVRPRPGDGSATSAPVEPAARGAGTPLETAPGSADPAASADGWPDPVPAGFAPV